MAYQSPLHILEALNLSPDSLQASDIGRLRKKLMADFTLSQDITITIGNAEYSKDEVIKLLDNLAGLRQLDAHLAIFRNEDLLHFCEFPVNSQPGDVETTISGFAENPETPPHARHIIGQALLEALTGSLKQREYTLSVGWHKIIQTHFSDLKEQLDEAVIHHLIDTGEMLEAVNEVNYPQENIEKSLLFLTQKNWVEYLNFCMNDYRELIETLVAHVIDLTVRLQQTQQWFCYKVGGETTNLNVNEELKKLLLSNYKIYRANAHQKPKNGDTSIPWGWLIWILILGLRVCTSCDKNSTKYQSKYENGYQMESIKEYMNKAGNTKQPQMLPDNIDSLLKKEKDKIPEIGTIEIREKRSARQKSQNSNPNENSKPRENPPVPDSNGLIKPQ